MGVKLKKIEIFNFRSIKSISIKVSELSVFVGTNDAGKSNILRALNLFFNDETNPNEELAFLIDHNVHNDPNQRAKEIRVRLEIDIPDAYKKTNGEYIVWEKKWRKNGGLIKPYEYYGVRETKGPRGGTALESIEIPPRSNMHTLLRNINFVYVPAIKDTKYFNSLRAGIYKTIAEVATDKFHISSGDFERSIAEHLEGLTSEVTRSLGFESKLALPRDLSHIFESLDFLNESRSISLNERGDGVKTRHIPIILKFMADKVHSLHGRGAQPHTFIWGYEEPENNLELGSSIKLADQILDYLSDGVDQILLTTHSPVFYNLHRQIEESNINISCHHIFRETEEAGTKEISNPADLDHYMGTMTLFAPHVAELTDRIKLEQEALHTAQAQQAEQCSYLYVEGESDKTVFKKAIKLFAPEHADNIIIETKNYGGGHSYVVDMLSAWRHIHKHHTERPKAAGLVDGDTEGKNAKTQWNKGKDNCLSAKCFTLNPPTFTHPIKSAGFDIPIVLETLYPRHIWEDELAKNRLEAFDYFDILHEAKKRELTKSKDISIDDLVDDEWSIYIKYKFPKHRKNPTANKLATEPNEQIARENLKLFEPVIKEIILYLFGPAEQ